MTHWEKFDALPDGWVLDKTVGSPVYGYVFATNGVSILNGGKRILVKTQKTDATPKTSVFIQKKEAPKSINDAPFPAKTFNELARKRFELRMLADIRFDLAVCEIEGWPKDEYLKELLALIKTITIK